MSASTPNENGPLTEPVLGEDSLCATGGAESESDGVSQRARGAGVQTGAWGFKPLVVLEWRCGWMGGSLGDDDEVLAHLAFESRSGVPGRVLPPRDVCSTQELTRFSHCCGPSSRLAG